MTELISQRIYHHVFAVIGSLCLTLITLLMVQSDLLSLSAGQTALYLTGFWIGNLLFIALFFLPIDESFKQEYLLMAHLLAGQIGLLVLGAFSTEVIEVSMMFSLATFVFVVFGLSTTRFFVSVFIVIAGFWLIMTGGYTFASDVELVTFTAYAIAATFIAAVNSFAGNLQLHLASQNLLIQSKSALLEETKNALAHEKLKAEEASHSKTRFLAAASHDLRQPLHALELFIEALAGRRQAAGDQQVIQHMQKSANELRELLNGLFDISRFDTQTIVTRVQTVNSADLLSDLASEFLELSTKVGVPLKVRNRALSFISDPILVSQIIRGLVANALQHAGKGRVLVGIRRRDNRVRVEVWDSGVGIQKLYQKRIFEEFYQVRNSNRNQSMGLGLGLALIERMCRTLGHELGMRSQPGRGSVFWVEAKVISAECEQVEPNAVALPPGMTASNQGGAPSNDSRRLIRVAVIDDEPAILLGTRRLLEQWGYTAFCASSEADLQTGLIQSQQIPDLILCDYRLAEQEDGISVIRRLRLKLKTAIPAALITGDLNPTLQARARAADIRVLKKPFSPVKLKLFIERLSQKKAVTGD